MTGPHRIVVFTGQLAYSVRKGIVEIDRAVDGISWLIVVQTPKKTPKQMLKSQWMNLRRNGWRWIPYQTLDILQRLGTSDGTPREPGAPGEAFTVEALQAQPNVKVLRVESLHSAQSIDRIRAFTPDLGLSLAAPILREPLFSLPRLGTINLHKGKVPDYRGMPPAFWETWNNESVVGCTVHRVDAKLDTGHIVRQTSVQRAPYSTVRGLQLQLDEIGIDLTTVAVQDLLAGRAVTTPQPAGGSTYRKPALAQVAALDRREARAQTGATSGAVRALKVARTRLAWALWHVAGRCLLPPRITVLLYHRVSDDVRDNLTVGIAQFERQMALLRERCRPLSIEQVLGHTTIPASDKPLVAVTFDDGYLDNFEHAAPILARHGIPAAFFVSTGIVDTDGRFPHDLRRGNPPIPVMTWAQ